VSPRLARAYNLLRSLRLTERQIHEATGVPLTTVRVALIRWERKGLVDYGREWDPAMGRWVTVWWRSDRGGSDER